MSRSGSRVGAVMKGQGNKVWFFGWGVYEGDFAPPWGRKTVVGMEIVMALNPRIKLDNGKIVWGCECWWGEEEKMKKLLEGKEIIDVDIDEERNKMMGSERN